ncbi:MAG: Fe-S cluster assembly protein SufD [Rhodobacteraceae bacterium]|nr:Fe-S cluster assembly protein SufD [Paracoccaceae bacterium]
MGEVKRENLAEALLARHSAPRSGAGWALSARRAARDRVLALGAAGRRDEYWRYTNPAALNGAEAPDVEVLQLDETPVFDGVEKLLITFVDGVYRPDLSDDLQGENLEIMTLEEALEVDIHWASDLFGVFEARGQNPVPRPFAALNTAMAGQGVVIRANGKVTKPVALRYCRENRQSDVLLHHVIRVESGAELTVLENGAGGARLNTVMEVDVADGGSFHHLRAQGRDHTRLAITHIFARLGAEARFKSFTLTVNGQLTRNEVVLDIDGDDTKASVAGACLGDGDFLHDDTIFVTHDARDCESRQVFKKVLKNGATGVFQGKILVKADAQKTDGYQISQGLLLDDDSNFLAKPELEIYADDVACSHGSTCGAVDENSLFYLMSRGVPRKQAQNMMILAFLDEAIAEIENEELAEDIRTRLSGWAERHSA